MKGHTTAFHLLFNHCASLKVVKLNLQEDLVGRPDHRKSKKRSNQGGNNEVNNKTDGPQVDYKSADPGTFFKYEYVRESAALK